MEFTLEQKIRLKAILVYVLMAALTGGFLVYVYRLRQQVSIQKHHLAQQQQTLRLSNRLIVNIQKAQTASNLYAFSGEKNHLKDYRAIIRKIDNQIDSLRKLPLPVAQTESLHQISILLRKKEQLVKALGLQLQRTNPLDTLQRRLEQYRPERTAQTVVVSTTQRDTLKVSERKKNFWRRIGKVFSADQPTPPMQVTTMRVDTIRQVTPDSLAALQEFKNLTQAAQLEVDEKIKKIEVQVTNLVMADQLISNQIAASLIDLQQYTFAWLTREILQTEATIDKNYQRSAQTGMAALGLVLLLLVFIFVDLSKGLAARVALEKEKKKSDALLESRHQMLLSVSHDIKTPLTSILGHLNLMAGQPGMSELAPRIESMEQSARHLLDLVQNLLEFSRLEQGKLELQPRTFSLDTWIKLTADMVAPLARLKGLDFALDAPAEPQLLWADDLKIKQIALNLLSNAIKYTARGEVTLKVTLTQNSLQIAVSDTGSGIAPALQKQLFEPFHRLEQAHSMAEGSGYGLFVVKGLVALLNGRLHVHSEPGKGSAFTVEIPVQPVDRQLETASPPLDQWCNNPAKILIFDDDETLLGILTEMLQKEGLEVRTVCGNLDTHHWEPNLEWCDAILTDLEMGQWNGKGILKEVHLRKPELPVILMTARDDRNEAELKTLGFAGYLPKPFDAAQLRHGLGIRHTLNTLAGQTAIQGLFPMLSQMLDHDTQAIEQTLRVFVEATRQNLMAAEQAADAGHFALARQICHKMLPMIIQLNQTQWVPFLKTMDQQEREFTGWQAELANCTRAMQIWIGKLEKEMLHH